MNLAIDLGTANTLVYREGHGIVYNQPALLALNARTGQVLAVGEEAWGLVGGSPGHLVAERPLRAGTVSDFETTRRMLELVLRRVGAGRLLKPRLLVCVRWGASDVERRAVQEAAELAGARSVALVDEPLVAAAGANLPLEEPFGNLVLDIGGATTQAAVISMGGVVTGRSVAVGGFDMDDSIRDLVRSRYGVAIGEKTAEDVKLAVGGAHPPAAPAATVVRGREVATGLPRELELSEQEVRAALDRTVGRIVDLARSSLADAPPELTHDILEGGISLTGGGGLLRGIDARLRDECDVPVHVADRPLETVVRGAGGMLRYLSEYQAGLPLSLRR